MKYYISAQQSLDMGLSDIKKCDVSYALSYLKLMDEIGVDTETEGLDCHSKKILLLQLGNYDHQFVIDASTVNILQFKPILKEKPLIFANAQFDLGFLFKDDIHVNKLYDVMLAEQILFTGFGDKDDLEDLEEITDTFIAESYVVRKFSLAAMAFKYCDVLLDKDVRGMINRGPINDRIITYAADDIKYLALIKQAQLEAFESFKKKFSTTDAILDLENEVVKVLALISYNGIKVDKQRYLDNVLSTVKSELYDSKLELNKIAIEEFQVPYHYDMFTKHPVVSINWDSPKQKLSLLRKIVPKLEDTNSKTIQEYQSKHKIFKQLIEYNKVKKLESAFGTKFLNFINPVTGKMHTSFWQILKN